MREDGTAERLMQSLNHRIKNNLQLVHSLLQLQAGSTKSSETRDSLERAAARVLVFARVHERLYKTRDVEGVDLQAYLGDLCRDIEESLAGPEEGPSISLSIAPLRLPIESVLPLGLVVNELLDNAARHAYGQGPGVIELTLECPEGAAECQLAVADQGPGLPEGTLPATGGMGTMIVKALTRQLGGTLAFGPGANEKGARIVVGLPRKIFE